MMADTEPTAPEPRTEGAWSGLLRVLTSGTIASASLILLAVVLIAIAAPILATTDPLLIHPTERLRPGSLQHWFGTDALGRDVYARVVYGARTSLIVGTFAAVASITFGLVIGVIAGYFRMADLIIMRVMDGVMAIPSIVLAVALVAISGASMTTVLVAIAVPEIPRVVRLVRGVILSLRSEPYVEAAISLGTPAPLLLVRHMIPNTMAPLIVQSSFVLASAILTEAALSFLGVGLPPEIPSWGNIMSEGRKYFQLYPALIFIPGAFLAVTVLSVNLIGDALRDALDPKMAKRLFGRSAETT
jgi:peptide/nickel transport system permease protein